MYTVQTQTLSFSSISDNAVVRQVLSGDNEAFAELLKKYKNYIYTVIVRNSVYGSEADELFQEIFIKIFTKLTLFNESYSFKNWIFTIALNHTRNYRRTQFIRNVLPVRSILLQPDTPCMDSNRDVIQEKELNHALAGLPRDYFTVIMFFYYENKSYDEIAYIMKKPTGTIKTYLFRAKKILKKKLKHLERSFV